MADLQTIALRMITPLYEYHQFQGESQDCGPTSLAIAANALLGEERYIKKRVSNEMNAPGFTVSPFPHFVVRRVKNWATFPWGIVNYARSEGFRTRWAPFGTQRKLQRNLENDRITLVFVGQPLRFNEGKWDGWAHIKVLYGYTPGKGYVFVDPGHSAGGGSDSWASMGLFWQSEDDFLRYWRGLLRIYVEIWRED